MYRIIVDGLYRASFEDFDSVVAYVLMFCKFNTVQIQYLGGDDV